MPSVGCEVVHTASQNAAAIAKWTLESLAPLYVMESVLKSLLSDHGLQEASIRSRATDNCKEAAKVAHGMLSLSQDVGHRVEDKGVEPPSQFLGGPEILIYNTMSYWEFKVTNGFFSVVPLTRHHKPQIQLKPESEFTPYLEDFMAGSLRLEQIFKPHLKGKEPWLALALPGCLLVLMGGTSKGFSERGTHGWAGSFLAKYLVPGVVTAGMVAPRASHMSTSLRDLFLAVLTLSDLLNTPLVGAPVADLTSFYHTS